MDLLTQETLVLGAYHWWFIWSLLEAWNPSLGSLALGIAFFFLLVHQTLVVSLYCYALTWQLKPYFMEFVIGHFMINFPSVIFLGVLSLICLILSYASVFLIHSLWCISLAHSYCFGSYHDFINPLAHLYYF